MAYTWSAALNSMQISRQHGSAGRDMQTLLLTQEQKSGYALCKLRQRSIRLKQKGSVLLYASISESVEDKGTDVSQDKETMDKSNQAEPSSAPLSNPFVGAKISSRIAAKASNTSNGRDTASTTIPTTPTSSKTPGALGLPPFNLNRSRPQGSSPFSPKPPGSQTLSPKPSGSQGSPFSIPLPGSDKLKGAKPSVFLDSKAGSSFKKPGSQSLVDNIRRSENSGTKFGQAVVPKNLFDEPDKLTAEEKKFEFTFNAGQWVLVFSFLTIIGVMLGTAYVVWKVGAIHYNEF